MSNILFLSTSSGSFVTKDYNLLSQTHDVIWNRADVRHSLRYLIQYIIQIKNCDIVVGWFASPSVSVGIILASLFGRPSILIAGGYDVAREPEINYGLTLKRRYELLTKTSLESADLVLAVSKNTQREVLEIAPDAFTEVAYVGAIDTNKFHPKGEKDDSLIITVGNVKTGNLRKKGLEYFAKASNLLPNKKFVIIGKHSDQKAVRRLINLGGDNLIMTGYISPTELIRYYQRAKIYVQASVHESFGLSLAEAMACECVPVVSENAALPEVVGDIGVIIESPNPDCVSAGIITALDKGGVNPRDRILGKFRIEHRRETLTTCVRDILKS